MRAGRGIAGTIGFWASVFVVGQVVAGGVAAAAPGGGGRLPLSLQVKWVNQAQFAGYFVALDRGEYRAEGLDVTLLPGGPEIAPEDVVASGKAQFGIDWLSALLVARERGLPLVNIAQVFQESGMRMVAFRDTGIESIQDFRGRRVGVWPSGNEYQFLALMAKEGLSPPGDFMTVVPQLFEISPFLNREIDVAHAMTYNELALIFDQVDRSAVNVFDYNRLGVNILEDGIFGDVGWLERHPRAAERFLRASLRGWQWAIRHPAAAGMISFRHAGPDSPGGLAHQVGMAREVSRLIDAPSSRGRPIGWMDPLLYERTWRTLLEEGVLSRRPVGAFTPRFWRDATR